MRLSLESVSIAKEVTGIFSDFSFLIDALFYQMAYNLRRRPMREALLDKDNREESCFGGNASDDEIDNVSEQSESDSDVGSASEVTEGKPNIVLHYNETKGGTDCFDQLCHAYTVTRKTPRWPMRYFFGILDQAAVNARILYNCQNLKEGRQPASAIECLQSLYVSLVTPHLQERYSNAAIRKDILIGISSILGRDLLANDNPGDCTLPTKKRCFVCRRNKDNKTQKACYSCNGPLCMKHRLIMCPNCVGRE